MNINNLNAFALIIVLLINFNSFCQTTKPKLPPTKYSEEFALQCISDYYSFYNAAELYSDPVLRRISNNVFYVSIKYCSGGYDICYKSVYDYKTGNSFATTTKNDFFWNSKVLVLTINSKTKYTVKVKELY